MASGNLVKVIDSIKSFREVYDALQGKTGNKVTMFSVSGVVSNTEYAYWDSVTKKAVTTVTFLFGDGNDMGEVKLLLERKVAIPFLEGQAKVERVSVTRNRVNVSGKGNKVIFVNRIYADRICPKEYVYAQGKGFVPAHVLKDGNLSGKVPVFRRQGMNMLLVLPEKPGQGECDFLSLLHPHAWKQVCKERVKMSKTGDIAGKFRELADGISVDKAEYAGVDCLCVVSGGGEHVRSFSSGEVVEAVGTLRKACARKGVYMVAGIGHTDDLLLCAEWFDYSAVTPTAAAMFLNEVTGYGSEMENRQLSIGRKSMCRRRVVGSLPAKLLRRCNK